MGISLALAVLALVVCLLKSILKNIPGKILAIIILSSSQMMHWSVWAWFTYLLCWNDLITVQVLLISSEFDGGVVKDALFLELNLVRI